jgi:hypothetical protein
MPEYKIVGVTRRFDSSVLGILLENASEQLAIHADEKKLPDGEQFSVYDDVKIYADGEAWLTPGRGTFRRVGFSFTNQ